MAEQLILKGTLEGHVRFHLVSAPFPWIVNGIPRGRTVFKMEKNTQFATTWIEAKMLTLYCRMAGSPLWPPPWRSTSILFYQHPRLQR